MAQAQSGDGVFTTNVAIAAAAETIVLTGNATAVESPTCKVLVKAFTNITPGTGTTSFVFNVYRGTVISAPNRIYQQSVASGFTVGAAGQFSLAVADVLNNAGGAQYCVSVQQVAGSGAGTLNAGLIETVVLSG